MCTPQVRNCPCDVCKLLLTKVFAISTSLTAARLALLAAFAGQEPPECIPCYGRHVGGRSYLLGLW
jgi:hypothetical protein